MWKNYLAGTKYGWSIGTPMTSDDFIQVYDGHGNAPKPPPRPKPQLPANVTDVLDDAHATMAEARKAMDEVRDRMKQQTAAIRTMARANVTPPALKNVGGEGWDYIKLVLVAMVIVGVLGVVYAKHHTPINDWILRNMGPR